MMSKSFHCVTWVMNINGVINKSTQQVMSIVRIQCIFDYSSTMTQ